MMWDSPIEVFVVFLILMLLAVQIGVFFRKRRPAPIEAEQRDDLNLILGASLTLLGLIIGFTFSMAVSRYDQRKNLEEEEANAIGTEYLRLELLPGDNTPNLKEQLRKYLEERILFYTLNGEDLALVNQRTDKLQADLWAGVRGPAMAQPTPMAALVVSGMNDVLNSSGYTQAAWWNRIPAAAWIMMGAIAVFCNVLLGYGARGQSKMAGVLFTTLPLIVSISFFLIADIDSPRRGVIRVVPRNLLSLADSLATTK
ncbi:MAG TPA: hypothetical protein VF753_08885 [Terriglobales bacterium]